MTKTFALCADDYGLSPGVCTGILELLRAQRLTAVSAMTNMPRWREFAGALSGCAADVGLHFNLTLGAPLGAMPAFAPGGAFPSLSSVIRAALLRRLPLEEIRAELDLQLDAFEAALGRPPDFVDGHQHVQALPGVRSVLIEALTARGLAGKCWLRDCSDGLGRILTRREEAAKALVVSGLSFGFGAAARRAGFATNDGFAGFSDFDAGKDHAARFASYLRATGPAHLVMCHPGHADAELAAIDPVTTTREQELAFLLSPGFEALVAESGLKLARLA
ncbi:MAG TPA: ChbG/HpnK family deacetylase [Methylocystis sp.]|nr:ChbG/HpnK family deacetylase [Methylocystis sp.]